MKITKIFKDNAFLAVILFLVLIFVSLLLSRYIPRTPELENKKNEVKKLPPEIKAQLKKESTLTTSIKVPILLYHYVEYVHDKRDTTRQSLDVTPNIFENQIKTLADSGYTFMTAKELGEVLDGKISLPNKPILITFDDGHWDLDTDVLPILKKYHAKATAYIISGFIGRSDFLNKTQLEDVISSKLVEIGAHTVHHVSLKGKFLPIIKYEVGQSKNILEQDYHIPVVSFAYPYGSFDKQVIDVVGSEGFETAVSTVPGDIQSTANRFFLFRIRPGYRSGKSLVSYLNNAKFSPYGGIKIN